jgi:hypothetical protein
MELFQYEAEVIRVIDGDTLDASISLGFNTYVKKRIRFQGFNAPLRKELDFKGLMHQNLEQEIWKKRKEDWLQKTEL